MQISPVLSGMNGTWKSAAPTAADLVAPPTDQADDELTLSDEGLAAAEGTTKSSKFLPVSEPLPILESAARFQQDVSDLQSRLAQLFEEKGIDTSVPIPLTTGADGSVIVAGNHPQKAEIEALFKEDRSLRNDFVEVQAMAEFKRAAEEAIAFQEAYRKDPEAAVQAFGYLFGPRTERFAFVMQGDSAEIVFR